MKIFVKKFGTTLISRPAGKEAFLALQILLEEITASEKIEIDFEGVSVLTPSWADEFITPLQKQYPKRIILSHTDNPSVQATLSTLDKSRSARHH
ncbi:MAG: STAS-like domain-containing protein [Patescibacteria group bacterium]